MPDFKILAVPQKCVKKMGKINKLILDEIDNIISRIIVVFKDVQHPSPEEILESGCCDEHDSWIDSCSKLNYMEFKELLLKGHFDFAEYCSLFPKAFHYFLPGIILFVLDAIKETKEYDEYADYWWWVDVLVPLDKNKFIKEYLPLFTVEQRKVVVHFIDFALKLDPEQDFLPEGLEDAKKEVWAII